MKARIKETGEIVGLAQEIRGHKGESFQWFQIELIPEPYDEFFDWQSFRNQAAKDILCSIIQGGYAESRIKLSLGGLSPIQYRKKLGLIVA